jgi:outer membrane biogenesis lipoprotein LolB
VIRRIAALLIAAALLAGCNPTASVTPEASDQVIANAFNAQVSGVQVVGSGIVIRTLSDDADGGRHQRFSPRCSPPPAWR